MFYKIVKTVARIAIKFYCRDIKISHYELLKSKGPLLLAVNHPNSFLDAIILCTLFDEPVYSLARGDAFKGKATSSILTGLKILPVYRISEGVENLEENYTTFSACIQLFKQQRIVLIFSEGRCENEWHLRPLKKGTARLALAAWQQDIPLKVLPVGMNYSSFRLFGKNVHINMGEVIEANSIVASYRDSGRVLNELTGTIQKQLQSLVYEIDMNDYTKKLNTFQTNVHTLKKALLILPGAVGMVLHLTLYIFLKQLIVKKALPLGHFDSIMVGLLLVAYPCYLLLWSLLVQYLFGGYQGLLPFIAMPFFAWCYVQVKKQVD
jgi:1-acyl-sn-glycerol-3-phosphate acyltransferase